MVDKKLGQQVITSVNTAQFNGMGFIGIKKVEYFPKEGDSILFNDPLELLENRNYTNNLMLGFFSINPFGTEKVDKIDSIVAMNEEVNEMVLKQSLKKAALFDFAEDCDIIAGEVGVLVVADAIIHWDNGGSYIQPTQDNSLILDLTDILKVYPASYNITIYSERDLNELTVKEFEQKRVIEVPLKSNMWYNQPNFQEIYGTTVLGVGLLVLGLTYGIMNWQESTMTDISSQIKLEKSKTINQAYYTASNQNLSDMNKDLSYSGLRSIIIKDISNSLSKSGFKLGSLDLKPAEQDNMLLVTIESKDGSHTQFSVQEPLAKRIINNSKTIKAIRKNSNSSGKFTLEALVDLSEIQQATKKVTGKGE